MEEPSALIIVKDVAIIILTIQSLVVGALLIVLLLQIRSLTVLLQREIKPILDSVQDTAGTVRGTATIVSDYVVSPVARVASFVAGVRETLASFSGRSRRRSDL